MKKIYITDIIRNMTPLEKHNTINLLNFIDKKFQVTEKNFYQKCQLIHSIIYPYSYYAGEGEFYSYSPDLLTLLINFNLFPCSSQQLQSIQKSSFEVYLSQHEILGGDLISSGIPFKIYC